MGLCFYFIIFKYKIEVFNYHLNFLFEKIGGCLKIFKY